MSKTVNYKLEAPTQDDFYNVDAFSENFTIIDSEMKKIKDKAELETTWSNLGGKPDSFPPTQHGHNYSEIQGKPESFQPAQHNHTKAEVGLPLVDNTADVNKRVFSSGYLRTQASSGGDHVEAHKLYARHNAFGDGRFGLATDSGIQTRADYATNTDYAANAGALSGLNLDQVIVRANDMINGVYRISDNVRYTVLGYEIVIGVSTAGKACVCLGEFLARKSGMIKVKFRLRQDYDLDTTMLAVATNMGCGYIGSLGLGNILPTVVNPSYFTVPQGGYPPYYQPDGYGLAEFVKQGVSTGWTIIESTFYVQNGTLMRFFMADKMGNNSWQHLSRCNLIQVCYDEV